MVDCAEFHAILSASALLPHMLMVCDQYGVCMHDVYCISCRHVGRMDMCRREHCALPQFCTALRGCSPYTLVGSKLLLCHSNQVNHI